MMADYGCRRICFNLKSSLWLVIITTTMTNYYCCSAMVNINLQPKQTVNGDVLAWTFRGNSTHQSNHFRLLERDGASLLVGARNTVYKLNVEKLQAQKMLDWPSTAYDTSMCRMKGKSEEDCHNYVRVLIKQSTGRVLVCGTNAYKPICRQYVASEDGQYQMQREFSGFAISPYDPRHNSTAIYFPDRDELYSGTVSDFTASDPLIYRKPLSGGSAELRTQRNNLRCLNDPNFVSAVSDDEAVYFFLRESALESNACGKSTYARVARVCRNDRGGTRAYSDTWTTFLKARLNCSIPGHVPFAFNEIQSTSGITFGQYGSDAGALVYAVFTTPYNGMQTSAVCAFRMSDIQRVFTQSAFKAQPNPASMWMPVPERDVPSPRPGSCASDSTKLADDAVQFVHRNSLMDESVPSYFSQPLIVDSNLRWRYTQIAVHSNVRAVDGSKYDVLFVGTNDGRVLKFVNIAGSGGVQTVLVEMITVFAAGQTVNNLLVYTPEMEIMDDDDNVNNELDSKRNEPTSSTTGRLIVVSDDEVKVLPLHRCANRTTCFSCVRLQDPYCAWDMRSQRCVGQSDWDADGGVYYKQAIDDGSDENCPEGPSDNDLFAINDLSAQSVYSPASGVYSAESMAVAVVMTLAGASLLGFIAGYRFSYLKSAFFSPEYAASSSSSSTSSTGASSNGYGTHHQPPLPPLNRRDFYDGHGGGVILPQSKQLSDSVNLMLSLPDVKTDKNILTLNNGTLPKDYKAKKVYL